MTNFEKIKKKVKNMSAEEMAKQMVKLQELLCDFGDNCYYCPMNTVVGNSRCTKQSFAEWLNSEVPE